MTAQYKNKETDTKEGAKEKPIQVSSFQNRELYVEIVFDVNKQPKTQFAVFDRSSGEVSYEPELDLGDGRKRVPPQQAMINEGKILFPSSADDYINEITLLKEIETFIAKYLDLPDPFYFKLVSHYVLLTWVYDRLSVVPYLRALGDYGSGKTRFAQAVGSICFRPIFLAGATSDSFIFRMIELFKGTMVINELERVNTDLKSQIVLILNNGYEKSLYVGRVEGERKKEPKTFDVFSPKIITSREKFRDLALESRILSIPMRPTKRKDLPTLLDESFWEEAKRLRNKLLMYRFNNIFTSIPDGKEEKLSGVEPRLRQTLLPLLCVIQDSEVEKEFIDFATKFQSNVFADRGFETDAVVAEKLLDLLEHNPKVTVGDVTEQVNLGLSDKEKLTSKTVGRKIRNLGFETRKIMGTFRVIPDQSSIEFVKDRYGFSQPDLEENTTSPRNPLPNSVPEVDLVDKVDIKSSATNQFTPERTITDFKNDELIYWVKDVYKRLAKTDDKDSKFVKYVEYYQKLVDELHNRGLSEPTYKNDTDKSTLDLPLFD